MAFVFIFRENWKKNLSICNETPKICDLLMLFCLNVLCNYYVIFFWRDRISPNPCAIFILFWWVKNECLWHSVRTPNRDMFFVLDEFWMNFEWTLNELWTNFPGTIETILFLLHKSHLFDKKNWFRYFLSCRN